MSPFTVPSIQDSSQNNGLLSTYLANNEFRKLYNQTLGLIKKFQNIYASYFLKNCIEEAVIPTTFLITNKPHNTKSKNLEANWKEICKDASINHMKDIIKEQENKASELLTQITEAFNTLNFLIPEEAKEALKLRFAYKGKRFKILAETEKQ